MKRPRLLDLFCGAGGCSKGYSDAGFEVVGVDIEDQPNYLFEFYKADAMTFPFSGFDAIVASPPCQGYSRTKKISVDKKYPMLISKIRERLIGSKLPYVIENVEGALPEMVSPTLLCGAMFGLNIYRHRLFEVNFSLPKIKHPEHLKKPVKMGRWSDDAGAFYHVVGHFSQVSKVRKIMGIPWMNRDELAQAIPPAYTAWVGKSLIKEC